MPRAKPDPFDLDDDTDESSVQRIVSAAGAVRPVSTAANSIFEAGRMAKVAAKPPLLTRADIVIRKGVAKPSARSGTSSVYLDVLAEMKVGDSVELPTRNADGFYAVSKRFGDSCSPVRKFAYRKVNPTHGAIWRDA